MSRALEIKEALWPYIPADHTNMFMELVSIACAFEELNAKEQDLQPKEPPSEWTWQEAPAREIPMDGIHQIPIPEGWSVEQTWETLMHGEGIPMEITSWALVEVRNGKFVRVIEPESDDEETPWPDEENV